MRCLRNISAWCLNIAGQRLLTCLSSRSLQTGHDPRSDSTIYRHHPRHDGRPKSNSRLGFEIPHAAGTPAKAAGGKQLGRRKKRNMSAEGKARIAEATRKRWEAYRAAKAAE